MTLPKGTALISSLYQSAATGMTGGVIGGLAAMGIDWLCGTIVSYILLILLAICMLLGGMGITVSGLIKAYNERPRAEWEDEEERLRNRRLLLSTISQTRESSI